MKLQGLVKVCAAMLFCLSNQQLLAQQLKLGTNPTLLDKNALLELKSDKQGFLLPRIIKAQILAGGALYNAAEGMLVYITDDKALYLKKTTGWEKIDFSILTAGTGIGITGNTISNTGVTSFNSRTGNVTPATGDYAITQLSDVAITAPADKQLLQYQSATSKWTNVALSYVDPSRTLSLAAGTGIASVTALPAGTDLSQNRTWTITANNGAALWNANQIQGKSILTTVPNEGDLLTFTAGNWTPKAPSASVVGVNTINALAVGDQFLRPLYTAGTTSYGFTSTTATHTLTIADASATIGGLVNIVPQTFKGAKTFNDGIVTSTLRINTDVGNTATKILGKDANGDVSSLTTDTTLTINTATKQLGAKNTTNMWNANKIQKNGVIDSLPGDGDVLKWNVARQLYVPAQDITGGASYGNLADNDITYADAPDPKYRMKIWASPTTGAVTNGPAGTSAWAWSVLSFQNTGYTTQLYFDKNTLALREWKNNPAPPPPLIAGSNPWYKVVTMHGDALLGVGGLIFGTRSTDSKSEVAQDSVNLFWDNTGKELGIKTNTPVANLDVNGTAKIGVGGTILNGIFRAPNQTIASIATGTAVSKTVTVTGAVVGGSVIVNPRVDFSTTFYILSSRVSSNNTVTIIFVNSTGSAVTNRVFDLTVIQ